jgi:hypothetical protein
MPIVIIFKNGLNIVVEGERIEKKEWKPGRVLKKKAMNGHEILIMTEAVAVAEHMPDQEYRMKLEEMQKQKEAEHQGSRIARPAFVIPKKPN